MRANILNKTVKKDNIPQALIEINKRSAAVYGDIPQKKAELSGQLAEAGAELREAKASLDAAGDLKEFDKAAEAVKRAETRAQFVEGAIRKLNESPRMSEAEYNSIVDTCGRIMEGAAADYREKVSALMDQIKEAKDLYLSIAANVDQTLTDLDEAANVLQTKYADRIDQYSDGKGGTYEITRPDPNEWRKHVVRYAPGTACQLANGSGDSRDKVLYVAWDAVSRAYPEQTSRR